jgi:UDP-N-acetylmuramate dehydrogenase
MTGSANLIIRQDVPMAPLTTLGVGGSARYFAEALTEDQALEALDYTQREALPLFVLGGGSNLLISDEGFKGFILRIANRGIRPVAGAEGLITAAAGEEWDRFVAWCVEQHWSGIECLSGIPGSVGGTPVQNVGAYGQEVSEVIESVRVLDRGTRTMRCLARDECEFGYRSSIFNTTERERYVILEVTYQLSRDIAPTPLYPDLQNALAGHECRPTLIEIRDIVLQIRARKSMLADPADPNGRSAGSFFKNPIVSQETWRAVEQAARSQGILNNSESPPCYDAPGDKVKIPAAWLIEHAGFCKGFIYGNAGISSKHALALVNRGGAKSQEILDLMKLIQEKVYEVFGIWLSPEPVLVGF